MSGRVGRAALAAAAGMLVACGGGGAPAPVDRASLRTTDGVEQHLRLVMSQVQVPMVEPTAADLVPVLAAETVDCESGGNRRTSQETRDVGSPYGGPPFDLTVQTYAQCRFRDGPPDDRDAIVHTLDGVEERAERSADGVLVGYQGLGDAAGAPLLHAVRSTLTGRLREDTVWTTARSHWRQDGNGRDWRETITRRVESRVDGRVTAQGSYRFGRVGELFHGTIGAQGYTIDGAYEIATPRCASGEAQVATLSRLVYDVDHNRFVAGTLRLRAAEGEAHAQFLPDGSVRLVDARGEQRTLPAFAQSPSATSGACFEAP